MNNRYQVQCLLQDWGPSGRPRNLEDEVFQLPKNVIALNQAESWFSHILSAVQLVLRGGRGKVPTYRGNPVLTIYNPPMRMKGATAAARAGGKVAGIMSKDVHEVRYLHFEDKQSYKHPFEGKVLMLAVERPNGQRDIILTHEDGKPLWEDF